VRTFEITLIADLIIPLPELFPKQATPAAVYAQVLSDLQAAETRVPEYYAALIDTRAGLQSAVRAVLADYYVEKLPECAGLLIKSSRAVLPIYTLVAGAN